MKQDLTAMFKGELGRSLADQNVIGIDAGKVKNEFKEGEKKNYKPLSFLKKGSSLVEILELVKNKKLSKNKIKTEIKKHLKDPETINEFLNSILDSRAKKEESKEATGTGGGVGAYEAPLFGKLKEEKMKGGKADNKTFSDLVKKYKNKTSQQLKTQLNKGVKVEMEHTDNKKQAMEIAMDHLFEDPNYYIKLTKIETKEATSTASSGAYETPKMWAKSLSKKDWGTRRKTQIPGGKFVQVKKKCKRFPYCNQGDINALNLSENEDLQIAIQNTSIKYGISEETIVKFILKELETNKNN